MKFNGTYIQNNEGELMTKGFAFHVYDTICEVLRLSDSKINFKDLWVITNEKSAYDMESHGCLNFVTGEWEYLKEDEFQNLTTKPLDAFVRAVLFDGLYGEED